MNSWKLINQYAYQLIPVLSRKQKFITETEKKPGKTKISFHRHEQNFVCKYVNLLMLGES